MWRLPVLLVSLLALPLVASAQEFEEEDDFTFDGGESTEEAPPPERIEGPDDLELGDEEDEEPIDFAEPEEDSIDLLGDEPDANLSQSGDSAELFRQRQAEYARLEPDEEVAAWEGYLAEFPGTPFGERIQQRVDELMDSLYSTRIGGGEGSVDALAQQIELTQPILLENIDPRTRLRAGFEIGLPDWLNPFFDYEYAFARNISAHVGLRKRYTGTSIEPGVKYALVKSTRTNMLVSILADARLNVGPTAFVGARPMLGIAKRFGEKLDVQIQGGAEFEFRQLLGVRAVGGVNAFFRASDTVGMFVETNLSAKNIGGDAGSGVFHVATFGMKFFPSSKDGKVDNDVQVDVAASAPYATNYYAFHYGSFLGQANIFFD